MKSEMKVKSVWHRFPCKTDNMKWFACNYWVVCRSWYCPYSLDHISNPSKSRLVLKNIKNVPSDANNS